MKLWIARDKDNSLSISNYKLIYVGLLQGWSPPKEYYNDDTSFHVYIDDKLFPEVTFKNSPQEIELKLCNSIEKVDITKHNIKTQPCVLTNNDVDTNVIKFD